MTRLWSFGGGVLLLITDVVNAIHRTDFETAKNIVYLYARIGTVELHRWILFKISRSRHDNPHLARNIRGEFVLFLDIAFVYSYKSCLYHIFDISQLLKCRLLNSVMDFFK
jgi:hypothetical protein